MSILNNKRILITGGTGSIGSTLVKELLANHNPKQIRIFSRDDSKQFQLMQELGENAPVNFLIGDIRDKERLMRATENIDIVFHAAALKHVFLCERNPFEAYQTNVQGTQNVIDCALASGVDRVVNISTDKAVNPSSVLGTTKLMAERLMLSSIFYKGTKKTKFCSVRFGNVLWSRGSVFPLFIKQIRNGKPITVTDPEMRRFFMSMKEAAQLVLEAAQMTKESEIFVFKMPAVKIGDAVNALQEIMIEESIVNKASPIRIIGAKEGERKHEKLLTIEESENALETDKLYIILPNFSVIPVKKIPDVFYPGSKRSKSGEYCTDQGREISNKDLKKLLREGGFYKMQ
ncbi:MAG: polysaccharide biosynthesis protein [Candidatus Pacebacteria bacterium]|jgi:FlaA1/EpsC-like NDP-sugar epimerase|nr:polysaccharide biosynthesis protein [Candidatus Paceibacterota bacterium]